MSGFDNEVMYAKNADFTTAGAGGGSASNGLILDGQLWIGRAAVNAGGTHIDVATLTAGTGVSITNGPGSITIALQGGGPAIETLTGNSGGAISPTSNNINTLGTGSITIAGAGSTLTTQLTGLTNHAVLVGAGTATITNVGPTATAGQVLQSAGAAADPVFSTATYPSTTTISQLLYSSSANVVAGLSTANSATLVTNSTGVPVFTSTMTNGQVVIGSTGATPTTSTLTAGAGISITNAAGSITVALSGGGVAIDSIGTQTGTNPITPDSGGLVTINGAVVAAGTNPVRSDGTGANTMAIEVQTSQAIAAADATKIGLSNFDSGSFSVAATGFVTLATTGALKTLTGNSGGAISPTANNINTIGTGSITIAGAGSTLTTQLTGLTNHAVLVGAGTATITNVGPTATAGQVLQSAGAAADPVFSTATYPSTTTISQLLYSSSANVVAGLSTANSATLVTNSTGVPVMSSTMTNGQVIIGSTGATPAAGTLTAGTGVSITNGAGSITVNAVGSGLTWSVITAASQAMSSNNGYIANRAGTVAFTLPTTSAVGDIVAVTGINTATGWSIGYTTNQQIFFGTSSGTITTGSIASTNIRDTVFLVCVVANLTWNVINSVGNITIA